MNDFVPGQRWICDAELQMGLGTILSEEFRTVTIVFLSVGETRTYAKRSAPLTRVEFGPGDTILSHEGWELQVEEVRNRDGLLTYAGHRADGTSAALPEGELDNFIQLNRPADRLLTGQIDRESWFTLRYRTLLQASRLQASDLRGLGGSRTRLIPHQLYVAHEIANRYSPRVLLADEVGLGKTIEAGLILHHQLLTGRVGRVLIVVPEALLHQWIVEMLRRFNLRFSIFDASRWEALRSEGEDQNPFLSEQLVICTLDFLREPDGPLRQARAGEWDLLVVDEAHHLEWSAEQASPEYLAIEQLAAVTRGVLLLTATPEQLGKASHFARLRLLDPDRFHNLEAFLAEEHDYAPVSNAVDALLRYAPLDAETKDLLASYREANTQGLVDILASTSTDEVREQARLALVDHLLDRHGTGRVLFRNTRAAVQGFPEREVHPYPLALPEPYRVQFEDGRADLAERLCPESRHRDPDAQACAEWTRFDPRFGWLSETLKRLRPAKVLVIAASADTAMDLATALRVREGVHAAVFHEYLSIVERDRAAAFFADPEYGSQVLICSEIGSEGRNFQFAHHLVLFDLPLNPDLLEQRIGRLDRIGQSETIRIHVPYLEDCAQALLFRWYQNGLDAFARTCPAGGSVFLQLRPELIHYLNTGNPNTVAVDALIEQAARLNRSLTEALHRGRDRLLEFNSCRPHAAEALGQRLLAQEAVSDLPQYLEHLCDCFGIDLEPYRAESLLMRPTRDTHEGGFPGLPEEGLAFAYQRETALANEDLQFMTWEHPLVVDAMDMILSSELGNTSLAAIRNSRFKPGTLLLEAIFVLEPAHGRHTHAERYLPTTPIRVLIDERGNEVDGDLSHQAINSMTQPIPADTGRKVARAYAAELRCLMKSADSLARAQTPELRRAAHARAHQALSVEIDRLEMLKRVNPNVRNDEISHLKNQLHGLDFLLDTAAIRMDAIRLIVAT